MSTSLHLSLLILTLLWSKSSANPAPGLKAVTPFSFDDIFDASLRPRGFSPTWIAGEESFYYRSADTGNVMRRNAQTQEETVLVNKTSFDEVGSGTYFMSHDLSYVLFAYETQPLWRHSFNAKYKILNLATGAITDFPTGPLNGSVLNYARWAPSSNALSFVHENDLYYQSSPTADAQRITTDGHATDIFNGVPDWLYEEDVLGDRVTHYWSPNSTHICFAKINAGHVPFISWPLYGDKSDVFGKTRQIRYPKAGDVRNGQPGPNSVAELYLVDVTDLSKVPVKIPPPPNVGTDHYYVQVAWGSASALYVTWTNRVQNYSHSVLYDISDTANIGQANSLTYNVQGGWVEVAPPEPLFIDSDTYITIHPRDRGNSGSWRQLGVYNRSANLVDISRWISPDIEEEVDGIYGYDAANKFVYYSSTNGDPTERHIMKASLAEPPTIQPTCLTCGFPDSCRYITSSFSDSGSYYFVNCRGPEVPTYSLRSTLVGQEDLDVSMEDNAAVKQRLSEKALPTREFLDIPLGGGYSGRAEIFIPPDHVEGNTYPLLVYAYAGPGSQRVMKTFPMGSNTANWLTYLKSTHKVVIVSVDSRGASGRGDKFKFEMYRKLGTVEVQDQIAAGSHFGEDARVNKDKNKAVFGWSYGGGTAAHVIGDTSEVIKCGISVAPVTTKMYYDTAYTERYLGLATPSDNEEGYNGTDVMNKVENFRNKHFMLNHGMADDNVHYMHTTQLIQALANADILFRQNAFIDQNHGIGSPLPARHLYHSMTEFLLNDCWDGDTAGPVSYAPNLQVNVYLASIMSLITALHVFIRH